MTPSLIMLLQVCYLMSRSFELPINTSAYWKGLTCFFAKDCLPFAKVIFEAVINDSYSNEPCERYPFVPTLFQDSL